jgi:hypothetical protein
VDPIDRGRDLVGERLDGELAGFVLEREVGPDDRVPIGEVLDEVPPGHLGVRPRPRNEHQRRPRPVNLVLHADAAADTIGISVTPPLIVTGPQAIP